MENNSQAPKGRGRPAGSKNKRNKVAVVTNPSESMEGDGMIMEMSMDMGLHLNILEVPAGRDVIAAVYDFTNRHRLGGVSVTSTHGFVRNITLYQPNAHIPLYTYKDAHQLLSLMGNFYGSSSSIRPPSSFSTQHVASFVCDDGFLYIGTVHGKLIAESNVILGVSFINGTESIKLPPPPPPPCALPAPQNFFYLNGGIRTATAGLPELSSGAARSMTATAGLFSGAGRPSMATAGLTEFSLGAGMFTASTNGLLEFSSGAGRSRTAYGVPTAPSPSPSPSPLMSWNMLTNNFSSTCGSMDPDRSIVRENLG